MFILSISLPFDFISSLLFSLFLDIIKFFEKKKICFFLIEYLLGISRIELILVKSLEEVISSAECPKKV
jgi:hypothetical protein